MNDTNDEFVQWWRDRWQAVAEIERDERRALTFEDSFRALNQVIGMARALGCSFERSARALREEEAVRERWAKLKSRHQ